MGLGPQRLETPRSFGEDLLSMLFTGRQGGRGGRGGRGGPIDALALQAGLIPRGGFGGDGGFGGAPTLEQIATGNLPSFGGPFTTPLTGFQTGILDRLGGQAPDILSMLAQLGQGGGQAGEQLRLLSGPAALEGTFASLDEARRLGLGRDVRDIREQFSASGLRDTTDLARAITGRQAESETEQGALFGRLGLENIGQRIQAAQGLGGLQLGAAGTLPEVASGFFGLGERERQVGEQDILRRLGEFGRTQGALLPAILSFFGETPQIVGPGAGSQVLSALTTVGSGLLGGKG